MRLREFAPASGGNSGDYLKALASAWYNGVFDTGSLPRGIKTQEDVERLLNRGIVCPDGKTRKLHIDYNSDFDGVEIYSDDYYEHGDESGELDSRTGQPWGPYDHMEFAGDELDEGLNEVDRRGFLKGMGAAAVAGAGLSIGSKAIAGDNVKAAMEVGELDVDTKEYEPVRGQSKFFMYAYDSSVFVMRWLDSQGSPVGEPEILQQPAQATDNAGRPVTMYFGSRIAVKVLKNGQPEGDIIFMTPRSWIDKKIGWKSAFYQKNLNRKPSMEESVNQGVAEGIETVHGKKYSVDPDKYYVWAWDGAAVLYGEYDDIQDAKNNLPRIEQRAIKRLGPFAKDKFEIASGKDLLRRYEKLEGSLNEFAPAGGGGNIPRGPKTPRRGPWDDRGEDPYQPRRYNRSADFFDQFDSDGVDKQKFDKATGEYEGYLLDRDAASGITQIAYFKFDDPTKIGDNDPGIGWYYEPVDEGVAEGSLNEFAPDSNDGGEEDALHKYARMWWAGDEATQMQIERALAKMGWEIGEDEGSYDNGGVFVIRAGDINGRSYQSWPAEELTEGSDPFGPQGRYVGDTGPAQLTTTVTRVQLKPGDQVLYKPTEQRAKIEALSRDGTKARIHIATPMGGKTFNCKTSDLIAPGRGLAEVAPPGDKAERMVKHIKKGYAKDGKLTPKEKSIAYATAWKAHKKGLVESRDLCNVCGQTPCNCTH